MSGPGATPSIRGTTGYAEQAEVLIERYETLGFTDKHQEVLHLLPPASADAVDIGAGTGADAAWLAARGHRVLAVEPTEPLRRYGIARHASPRIEWLDDSLPHLARLADRGQRFGLVMATAVWMHLDAAERAVAMTNVARLLDPDGVLLLALRHGPVPEGRVMFEVDPNETVDAARACGLPCLLHLTTPSRLAANRDAGVTWSRLAFRRPAHYTG